MQLNHPFRTKARRSVPWTAVAFIVSLAFAPAVAAHTGTQIGEYRVEVGWRDEPPFVGQPNAVQLTIVRRDTDQPVTDLAAESLAVIVETAGVRSEPLVLEPAFDAQEADGPLGEYQAAIVPTAPGDYTFHFTGDIRGTAVDLALTSGPETFEPVAGSSDLEFPARLPNLTELGTRLDRIDARIAALQSGDPGAAGIQAAVDAATAAATSASAAADRALLVGAILGGGGVLLGAGAIALALRGRRGAGAA